MAKKYKRVPVDPMNEGAIFVIYFRGQILTPAINRQVASEEDPTLYFYRDLPRRAYFKLSVARGALTKMPEYIRKHATIHRYLPDKQV